MAADELLQISTLTGTNTFVVIFNPEKHKYYLLVISIIGSDFHISSTVVSRVSNPLLKV